jgi:hypothetical protein
VFVPSKSPVKRQPEILGIFCLEKLHIVYMDRGHVSFRVVNVTWIDLDPLAFVLHFLNQFWIASRLVCSFCRAVAGSLSVDTRSAVYSRYNNSPRALP